MHLTPEQAAGLAALCERYGVAKLEVFGSAARGEDDPARSDLDFLVTFRPRADRDNAAFLDLKEALARLFARPVDLIDRRAIEASRNPVRRQTILGEAQAVYGA